MRPELWRQTEDLFHAALEQSPLDRPAFLDVGWPRERYVYPDDTEATIYSAMGIDWTTVRYADPSAAASNTCRSQTRTCTVRSMSCGAVNRYPAEVLSEIRTRRVVHDNQTPVTQCFDGVTTVCGHDGNHVWLQNLRYSIDGHLQFPLDHFIDFFFGMEVLVN